MTQTLEQLENKIYLFIIKSFGFLHTLKKQNLLNQLTDQLSINLERLNQLYTQAIETQDKNEKNNLLNKTLQILKIIHQIYMDLHYTDKMLIHEKADLQVEASFLAQDLEKLLTSSHST